MKGKILVTGATGFVGSFVCRRLLADGYAVRAVRRATSVNPLPAGVEEVVVSSLHAQTSWQEALAGVDVVIHLAARVHVMKERAHDPLEEFRRVNVAGTWRLAQEAVKAGVKRLVFLSSVKVNGEESPLPYTEEQPPRPRDPYGVSKWEAEQVLRQIEKMSALEVVVLRPPLVYGPGVKANFLALLKLARLGAPLPLAGIDNRRSLIYVENLAHAVALCVGHPAAAGETFLVSDGEALSTADLLRVCAQAQGRPARLFPFPVPLLRLAGTITGTRGVVTRLTGTLSVDSSKIRRELGWAPPYTLEQGVQETAQWLEDGGRCRTVPHCDAPAATPTLSLPLKGRGRDGIG